MIAINAPAANDAEFVISIAETITPVSYTHLRAHETDS